MSTVFIAVQCFQCSTMQASTPLNLDKQVKQRKKSSNKWSCVICNEKQSVRKVFSQGSMAKDVRKFVQSFNMSRQFVEQQQELLEETLDQEQIENQTVKKRTDWSEYIEPDINDVGIDDDEVKVALFDLNLSSTGTKEVSNSKMHLTDYRSHVTGELCEPNVVTELPKPLFKKPNLRANYSASGLDREDDEPLRKPVFGKRIVNKKINDSDKELRTVKENSKSYNDKKIGASSNWGEYYETQHHDNADYNPAYKRSACTDDLGLKHNGLSSVMKRLKKPVSKWDDFIDDADDMQHESKYLEINHSAFETKVSDEIVEDDVHPDFL
ncbi:hypothetical protein LXL04_035873 [Taraxacum kok-saghyz]